MVDQLLAMTSIAVARIASDVPDMSSSRIELYARGLMARGLMGVVYSVTVINNDIFLASILFE